MPTFLLSSLYYLFVCMYVVCCRSLGGKWSSDGGMSAWPHAVTGDAQLRLQLGSMCRNLFDTYYLYSQHVNSDIDSKTQFHFVS